jgi:hypothetical protein
MERYGFVVLNKENGRLIAVAPYDECHVEYGLAVA